MKLKLFLFLSVLACLRCKSDETAPQAYEGVNTITYNGATVDVVISKPALPSVDVIIAYHGTVFLDSKILGAAQRILTELKRITLRSDIMFVSVAYPEENLLMGDNLKEAEAALLWVKKEAARELNVSIGKIYLVGHSQGGYLVTRLNTLYETDGVVANGPGPIDLTFRCNLEAAGQAPPTPTCTLLNETYGSPAVGEKDYFSRSLLNFVSGYRANIVFVQGMKDTAIQLNRWPAFKNLVQACGDCKNTDFVEIPEHGHEALFESTVAQKVYNNVIGY